MQYYNAVSKASIIKTFTVLIAMMFLFVQSVSQAHAASHIDENHSHDGVACEITLVAAEKTIITPPVPLAAPFQSASKSNWTMAIAKERPRSFDSRAPPPRGPPTH